MSLATSIMCFGSRFATSMPVLLVLWVMGSDGSPLFGLFDAFDTTAALNGTSLLGALALTHFEHTLGKVVAFAQLASLLANATETAIIG